MAMAGKSFRIAAEYVRYEWCKTFLSHPPIKVPGLLVSSRSGCSLTIFPASGGSMWTSQAHNIGFGGTLPGPGYAVRDCHDRVRNKLFLETPMPELNQVAPVNVEALGPDFLGFYHSMSWSFPDEHDIHSPNSILRTPGPAFPAPSSAPRGARTKRGWQFRSGLLNRRFQRHLPTCFLFPKYLQIFRCRVQLQKLLAQPGLGQCHRLARSSRPQQPQIFSELLDKAFQACQATKYSQFQVF